MVSQAPRAARFPFSADDLLGREREVALACDMLHGQCRLLTLLGPAGVGKTHLAVGIGSAIENEGVRETCFVDVTGLSRPAELLAAIASSLGLEPSHSEDHITRIGARLGQSPGTVVMLDGFDGVLPAAHVLAGILEAHVDVSFVVTSREPLRLIWEQRLVVPPLAVPNLRGKPSVETLLANPSVQLFARVATAVGVHWEITESNVCTVAEVCAGLEGLPSAIVLAALSANTLSIESMVDELKRSPDELLVDHSLSPFWHYSLDATLDSRMATLMDDERALLLQLSVFSSGFSLDTTAQMIGASAHSGRHFSLLLSLVDKGVVIVEPTASLPRFRIPETLRGYLLEVLADSGNWFQAHERAAQHLRDRAIRDNTRFAHIGAAVRVADPEAAGGYGTYVWAKQMEADDANFEAALGWFYEQDEAESLLRLAVALCWYWRLTGRSSHGTVWLRRGLEDPSIPVGLRSEAQVCLGGLLYGCGEFKQAQSIYAEVLAFARGTGDHLLTARILVELSWTRVCAGQLYDARMAIEESIRLFSLEKDVWGEAVARGYLCALELVERHTTRAMALSKDVADALIQQKDIRTAAFVLSTGAHAALIAGDLHEAAQLLRRCATIVEPVADPCTGAAFLELASWHRVREGNLKEAAVLLGAAEAAWPTGSNGNVRAESAHEAALKLICAGLTPAEMEKSLGDGSETGLADALALANMYLREQPSVGKESQTTRPARRFLSPREHEVLIQLARGRSNKAIAVRLNVSESTVKFHVTSVLNKLGVNTRTEAVSVGIRRQLVTLDETIEPSSV